MRFREGDIVTIQEYYGNDPPIRPQAVGFVVSVWWPWGHMASEHVVKVMWFKIEWDRMPCTADYQPERLRLHCHEI